jgi:eukaryotic-like serine/threonine-protein kinase
VIGRIILHYKLVSEADGAGLCRAEDSQLGRVVGLKFLPGGSVADDNARKHFRRDMKAIAALHHDNICAVHGIYQTTDGQWFIAMDYHEGETIRQLLSHGPLDPDQSLGLIAQIADGLEQAHRAEVLHGGIAPDSVVVTPDGVAKILDFGLVDVVPAGIIHSPDYASPEEIRGDKLDARSDIFSFGVVCYEMLSGAHPFRGPEETVSERILNETPPRLTGVNEPLDPIIQKMLAKNPIERYADLEHVMRDLANLHAPAPVEHVATHQRRMTIMLVAAIAVVATLMFWFSFHNR